MPRAVIPKVGAGWGSASRPDLCRGCRVTGIPTAIDCRQETWRGMLPHSAYDNAERGQEDEPNDGVEQEPG